MAQNNKRWTPLRPRYLISLCDVFNMRGEARQGAQDDEVDFVLTHSSVGIVPGIAPTARALITRWTRPEKLGPYDDAPTPPKLEGKDKVEANYKLNVDASVDVDKGRYTRAWVCRDCTGFPVSLKGAELKPESILHKQKPDNNAAEIVALCECVLEALSLLQRQGATSITIETDSKAAIEQLKADLGSDLPYSVWKHQPTGPILDHDPFRLQLCCFWVIQPLWCILLLLYKGLRKHFSCKLIWRR